MRLFSLPVGALALCGLVVFIWLHPLPLFAVAFCGLIVGLCLWQPAAWLLLLPALLPVVDLAAWTGAIYFTESDALVLCILLVLSLRQWQPVTAPARRRSSSGGSRSGFQVGPGSLLLLLLMAVSYLLSTQWSSLAGLWSDTSVPVGYLAPLNGPRLAKGFLFALLLLPFLWRTLARNRDVALRYLVTGLLSGLVLVSLATVWERWHFVGLSNFSADYRTTALFWEVNVGGAMLDAWLALTMPFLVWMALRVERPGQAAFFQGLLMLAGYAVFTTFSRGLYLGVAVGTLLMVVLMLGQALRANREILHRSGWGLLLAIGVGLALFLPQVFAAGGYRGLAATLAATFLIYLAAPVAATLSARGWLATGLIFLLASLLSLAATLMVAKGVYVIFGISVPVALALLLGEPLKRWRVDAAPLALGAVLWVASNAALVTAYWSEWEGLVPALLIIVMAVIILAVLRWRPDWCWAPSVPGSMRIIIALGGLLVLVLVTGTYYASERFETVNEDLEGREVHWSLGASLPQGTSEQLLGVGTGQYAQRYFWTVDDTQIPGTHELLTGGGEARLHLNGPRYMLGFGELYRVSQKVSSSLEGPFAGAIRARSPGGATVHLEICRKHLLYDGGCALHQIAIPAGEDWTQAPISFAHQRLGESGLLPRPTVFSIANASRGSILEVSGVTLIDAHGKPLLRNTDFVDGSDFWFFSSDRSHLPWHAKNLWLHYYVEQGLFGMLVFSALYLLALYRVSAGAASRTTWGPPLAGALMGFGLVGLFDSLLDAPRITLLFFLLISLALGIRNGVRSRFVASAR